MAGSSWVWISTWMTAVMETLPTKGVSSETLNSPSTTIPIPNMSAQPFQLQSVDPLKISYKHPLKVSSAPTPKLCSMHQLFQRTINLLPKWSISRNLRELFILKSARQRIHPTVINHAWEISSFRSTKPHLPIWNQFKVFLQFQTKPFCHNYPPNNPQWHSKSNLHRKKP